VTPSGIHLLSGEHLVSFFRGREWFAESWRAQPVIATNSATFSDGPGVRAFRAVGCSGLAANWASLRSCGSKGRSPSACIGARGHLCRAPRMCGSRSRPGHPPLVSTAHSTTSRPMSSRHYFRSGGPKSGLSQLKESPSHRTRPAPIIFVFSSESKSVNSLRKKSRHCQ
jgi:hypothetical protein